ncbi:MAG TPA: methyltransferase domain-containing protein [Nocardioides sp.]|uniref:class I SAM-dependent methyltransferase n=1 Tax=Nocardioides sp. TaxID=35761 RepID=UPI002F408A97
MTDCCDPEDYRSVFSGRFARRRSRRYRKRGLTPVATRLLDFAAEGIEGASVLEIGGGVGELQVELLKRGAARVTNLEISAGYEDEAARLLERSGLSGRVTRRILDIALAPDEVEPADVVVLHRVVCCYPDYQRLLTTAAAHAGRRLVFSHPADNLLTRAMFGGENLYRKISRNSFRAFIHPPDAMVAAAESQGLVTTYRPRSRDWEVVGLVR